MVPSPAQYPPTLANCFIRGYARKMPQDPPSKAKPRPAQTRRHASRSRYPRFPKALWQQSLQIAAILTEENHDAWRQIARLLQACGQDFTSELLQQTLELEAQGGLLLADGSRRRTPGGVFFHLAKMQMAPELRLKVFPAQNARPGRIRWPERGKLLPRLLRAPGAAEEALTTLEGQLIAVQPTEDYVLLTLWDSGVIAPIPKGVPHPSLLRAEYLVYASLEQWQAVQPALEDPQTLLSVEGFSIVDPTLECLIIYALQLSSTPIRKRRRK